MGTFTFVIHPAYLLIEPVNSLPWEPLSHGLPHIRFFLYYEISHLCDCFVVSSWQNWRFLRILHYQFATRIYHVTTRSSSTLTRLKFSKHCISTFCSRISQSVDSISFVNYLNLWRTWGSEWLRVTAFFGKQSPCNPYETYNHSLNIGIIIYPHIDNTQTRNSEGTHQFDKSLEKKTLFYMRNLKSLN